MRKINISRFSKKSDDSFSIVNIFGQIISIIFFIIILGLCSGVLISYTMRCDENYECITEKEYPFHKEKKAVYLSKNSSIDYKLIKKKNQEDNSIFYELYLKFTDKYDNEVQPLIYPYSSSGDKEHCLQKYEELKKEFNIYRMNPSIKFEVNIRNWKIIKYILWGLVISVFLSFWVL